MDLTSIMPRRLWFGVEDHFSWLCAFDRVNWTGFTGCMGLHTGSGTTGQEGVPAAHEAVSAKMPKTASPLSCQHSNSLVGTCMHLQSVPFSGLTSGKLEAHILPKNDNLLSSGPRSTLIPSVSFRWTVCCITPNGQDCFSKPISSRWRKRPWLSEKINKLRNLNYLIPGSQNDVSKLIFKLLNWRSSKTYTDRWKPRKV